MDWVGPAATGAVAVLVGIYLDRAAKRRDAITAADLRRVLLTGGVLLGIVAVVTARLTA